jgi:3-deoxy-manno-octulosonate cytidylyltransferase (CMP-KDO synthetase)
VNPSRAIVVIPARYRSSRFPGKPLAPILGQPMLTWVWRRCCEAVGEASVIVATDDDRIAELGEREGMRVEMTSPDHLTGTDRVAEVAARIPCDVVVNVQGDEPMLDPRSIRAVIDAFDPATDSVVNGMARIDDEGAHRSTSVPKVVAAPDGRLLYMSRAPIPMTKEGAPQAGMRQVCVYAFAPDALAAFAAVDAKTPLEQVEDIEILRFLELGIAVRMIELPAGSLAVDFPEDVEVVESAMRAAGTGAP